MCIAFIMYVTVKPIYGVYMSLSERAPSEGIVPYMDKCGAPCNRKNREMVRWVYESRDVIHLYVQSGGINLKIMSIT